MTRTDPSRRTSKKSPQPALRTPRAPEIPRDVGAHGHRRADEFHGLRRREDPRVMRHIRAENRHCERWFEPLARLRKRLEREMIGRIQETDQTVPFREDDWWYFERTKKGQPYASHWRRRDRNGAPHGKAQLLLDLNALARKRPYLDLGSLAISPDGTRLACTLDTTGALDFRLHAKTIDDGLAIGLPARLATMDVTDVQWGGDSRTLYAVTTDRARRANRLWRIDPVVPASEALDGRGRRTPRMSLLHEEHDERFSLGLSATLDGRWLVVSSESIDTTALWVMDRHAADARLLPVLPARPGREAGLEHRSGWFYLSINDTGPNFRLVAVPVPDARKPWRTPSLQSAIELIAQREDVWLESFDVFAAHLVLGERAGGEQILRVLPFEDDATGQPRLGRAQTVRVPDDSDASSHAVRRSARGGSAGGLAPAAHCTWLDINEMWDAPTLAIGHGSLTTPDSLWSYTLATGEMRLIKRRPVRGGHDPADYASATVHATAPDGTRVPISLVWRRSPDDHAGRPASPRALLLEGYGAYGIATDPHFSSSRLSLLDRGVVVALAHVRGGTELGRRWYLQGKLQSKTHSFDDFNACAQTLCEMGWTSPSKLVATGGSAGGLLVTAAANRAPHWYRAIVAEVPFVDVLTTMLDPSLPLTVGEYLEWGDPRRPRDYRRILAWSPYDNLRAQDYPAMLLTTSLNDSQVPFWEALKYAARLRTIKTDDHPVLVSVAMDTGHGGASGRYDAIAEAARVDAFMLWAWGLAQA